MVQSLLDGWTAGGTGAVRLLDPLSAPIQGGTIRQQDKASSVPCQRVRWVNDPKHAVRHRRLQRTTESGGITSQMTRRGWDDDRSCFVPCPHRTWLPDVELGARSTNRGGRAGGQVAPEAVTPADLSRLSLLPAPTASHRLGIMHW